MPGLNPPTMPRVWDGGVPSPPVTVGHPPRPELFPQYRPGQVGGQIPEGVGWEFRPGKFRPGRPPGSQKGTTTMHPESELSKSIEVDPFETTRLSSAMKYPSYVNASNSPYSARFRRSPEENAKAGLMGRFLDSLQDEEDTRADEMSRER